ncbi:MAG: glycosyltransferase family 2 protein [Alphaproteobacteria bacterium]|nr:glycosyltransferase family 2 protein [Alphaproteobacteria bacterium]
MKLSVIIPCYNVAPWVDRCLLSVTNQSLTDMEIICIDDKSTDNTLEILKLCAKNDLRIRILENDENMGVGYSRNRGIDAAQGEFVGFVDPDDWIESDFYKKLIKTAEKTQTPVVCGDVIEHPIKGKPFKINIPVKENFHHFKYHYSAVYLRDMLNRYNLHYPNLCIGEDSVFESMVKTHMPKPIRHVRGTAYHYMKHFGSLDAVIWGEKQVDDFITSLAKIIDCYNLATFVDKKSYEIAVERRFLFMCNRILRVAPDNQIKLATAACSLFKTLRHIDFLIEKDYSLVLSLWNNDPKGVIEIVKQNTYFVRDYKLFGKFKIATVHYSQIEKHVYLFGVKIWSA